MSLHLGSIGTALPEHRATQAEAVELQASFCRLDDKQARTLRAPDRLLSHLLPAYLLAGPSRANRARVMASSDWMQLLCTT